MESNLPSNSWASPVTWASSLGVACALLAACAVSSGCATAINGRTQRVAVASSPPGAQVYLHDAPVGVTPTFVDVPRRDPDLQLRLEKEGYESAVFPLERSRSGWSWGNMLLAGVPVNEYTLEMWVGAMAVYGIAGSLWDAMTGGAYTRPDLVRATLAPNPRPVNESSVEGGRDSSPSARPVGAPRAMQRELRDRLIPLQLANKVRRLTGRPTGWDLELNPRSRPRRPDGFLHGSLESRSFLIDVTDDVTLDRDPELCRQADCSRLRRLRRSPLAGADSAAREVEAPGDRCSRSAR